MCATLLGNPTTGNGRKASHTRALRLEPLGLSARVSGLPGQIFKREASGRPSGK